LFATDAYLDRIRVTLLDRLIRRLRQRQLFVARALDCDLFATDGSEHETGHGESGNDAFHEKFLLRVCLTDPFSREAWSNRCAKDSSRTGAISASRPAVRR